MSPSMVLGRVILPGIALALVAAVGYQWSRTGHVELPGWTGEPPKPPVRLVSADGPRPVIAQGRVVAYPGAQVQVGAEVAGMISRVNVAEKSVVKKGDLLLTFKSDDVKAQLDEATAHLAEAEAEVTRVEADEKKLKAAKPPTTDLERTHSYVIGYRARRDALKAARVRLDAQWRKHWAFAPIDGVVTARHVNAGETVEPSAHLLTIVDLSRLRVEAEIDEYDVAHCEVGSLVVLRAEAFPGKSWRGTIEEVADTLIPRRIRPEDPGRPTDTRVLPVRIRLHERTPLRLGQRVEVSITPGAATEAAPMMSTRPATTARTAR